MNLLGLSGSLRAGSLNTALLRALAEEAPEGVALKIADLTAIPLYNADLGEVVAVEALKAEIAQADGLIIATPEYNYSVPGVLKNALDWASRPAYKSVFARKPVAVIGAAASVVGTARAQAHLKNILLGMLAEVYPTPELLVGGAHKLFDAEGRLTDDATREHLRRLLVGFVPWAQR